jgi:hypothetical protein
VSQGLDAFDAALQGPEALAQTVSVDGELQCEMLLYAAEKAHERREGKPMPKLRAAKVVWTGRKWNEGTLGQSHAGLSALLQAQRMT